MIGSTIQFRNEYSCALAAQALASECAPKLDVPTYFLELLILIEDKRFPWHAGLDLFAIIRAAKHNLMAQGLRQGGSTLPQQLYNLSQMKLGCKCERNFSFKIAQIIYGVKASRRLSRHEILYTYLSEVYWGRNFRGLDQAASGYFEKSKSELDFLQSFFLVERLACPHRFSRARVANIAKRSSIVAIFQRKGHSLDSVLAFYAGLGLS